MGRVLVVGRGGREHALAWKFAASGHEVFASPGSAGMAGTATTADIDENDFAGLAAFARKHSVDLTVPGPEVPLVNGLADRFRDEGLAVFGPTAGAALIEGSKSFAKSLMKRHGIPTAACGVFDNFAEARRHVENARLPTVIKADGLAAGKGVVVACTQGEAVAALEGMMLAGRFGDGGRTVVIEEFLEGEEFSLIALVDGETVVPMEPARDHKRVGEGDTGPNTGGMGAYSPVPSVDTGTVQTAVREILERTARAMAAEGRPFTGFLYAGLIATKAGPKMIEFNARLGDPEAQVLLPRLESDLFAAITALLDGGKPELRWSTEAALGVVLAAKGYPDPSEYGFPVELPAGDDGGLPVFHCGTELYNGRLLATRGRVLTVTAKAATLAQAREAAYRKASKIECENLFFRTDIGGRA